MGLSEQRLERRNIFSPSAKIALMVLKTYTGFSDRQLVKHLNGNIHYQMSCGIMIFVLMLPRTHVYSHLPKNIFVMNGQEEQALGFGAPQNSCKRQAMETNGACAGKPF